MFVGWTGTVVGRMSPTQTALHATREDPTRSMTNVIVLLASIASLVGVGYLLAAGSDDGGAARVLSAGMGIASVIAAWVVVHTLYTLQYARLYYSDTPGGIDFNQSEPPAYADFAYLALTRAIRAAALRHALISYVLGAVVLGTVVNLVAGLGTG